MKVTFTASNITPGATKRSNKKSGIEANNANKEASKARKDHRKAVQARRTPKPL